MEKPAGMTIATAAFIVAVVLAIVALFTIA